MHLADEPASDDPVVSFSVRDSRELMAADHPVYLGGRVFGRRHFDYQVALHESGHIVTARMLGMPVAGSTIEFDSGHHGCTWNNENGLEPSADTVETICAALTPLMPVVGNDRSDIAVELLRAHHHVLELLAGVEAERLFIGTMLPGTAHDLDEATAIAGLICRSPASVDEYLAFARTEAIALLTEAYDHFDT